MKFCVQESSTRPTPGLQGGAEDNNSDRGERIGVARPLRRRSELELPTLLRSGRGEVVTKRETRLIKCELRANGIGELRVNCRALAACQRVARSAKSSAFVLSRVRASGEVASIQAMLFRASVSSGLISEARL